MNIPLKKYRNLFDKMEAKGKCAGILFCQRGCSASLQKDCPDRPEGVSFCRPVSGQATFTGWVVKSFRL
jgi:hypothetical protein